MAPFTDLLLLLNWWFDVFIIGISCLPLTILIFNKFSDLGFLFSKILGILITGYFVWLLASIRILPFSKEVIFFSVFLLAIINWVLLQKYRLLPIIKGSLKVFIIEEFIFLAAFLTWGFVKSFEPSIHTLEKFMDYGFINSILRSEYMPPKDMWMAGESINYYYFGHFLAAFLTKFSGINSAITYNLMLATLFGLCFSLAFSVGANIYLFGKNNLYSSKAFIVGLLTAFLITLSGNLQTIYAFFQSYAGDKPPPFWTLQPMLNLLGYWYPNATRFIPFTIHEFPLYSFVVSDLHGHVFSIPIVIFFIALLIQIFNQIKINLLTLILFGFLLATLLMTNVLDGPIYLLVLSIILFIHSLHNFKFIRAILETLQNILIVIFFVTIFSLPFWFSFKPFASGIGFICPPEFLIGKKLGPLLFEASHCDRSPFWMLSIIYGFFYITFLGFLIKKFKALTRIDYLILAFCLSATILILIPEQFYAKDIYPSHYRANTVFKLGYQAFIIFSLISGYMLITQFENFRKNKWFNIYYLILIPSLFLVSIYPVFAINSYYNGLKDYQGLNGINYLLKSYPSDYQAILWLRTNIKGQPVILESHGDSYSDHERISANTGLPTVIGWPVHEWLWRGSYDEVGKRASDVKALYEDGDIFLTQQLIKKYNIKLVVIGHLERQKYLNISESKFQSLGRVIFQKDQTIIYQLN